MYQSVATAVRNYKRTNPPQTLSLKYNGFSSRAPHFCRGVVLQHVSMDTYGNRIRQARQSQYMSVRQLSIRSGVARQHIKAIEEGKQKPHDYTVAKLCDALGLELDDLEASA